MLIQHWVSLKTSPFSICVLVTVPGIPHTESAQKRVWSRWQSQKTWELGKCLCKSDLFSLGLHYQTLDNCKIIVSSSAGIFCMILLIQSTVSWRLLITSCFYCCVHFFVCLFVFLPFHLLGFSLPFSSIPEDKLHYTFLWCPSLLTVSQLLFIRILICCGNCG